MIFELNPLFIPCRLRRLFTSTCFCISFFSYTQYTGEEPIRKEIMDLYITKNTDKDESYTVGENILRLAITDEERAKAYARMGKAMYDKNSYAEAIQLLEKGDYYALISGNTYERFFINFYLSDAYAQVGFSGKAQRSWQTAKKEAGKLKKYMPAGFMIDQRCIANLEEDEDYCKAIQQRLKIIESISKADIDISIKRIYNAANYSGLAYDYLKCGDIIKAKQALSEAKYIYENHYDTEHLLSLPRYYLSKAIIAVKEGGKAEGKHWFDMAFETAVKKKLTNDEELIVRERLLSNIDTNKELQHQNIDYYTKFYKDKVKQARRAAKNEIDKKETKVVNQNKKINILLVIVTVLVLSFLYVYKRKLRLKSKLLNALSRLRQSKEPVTVAHTEKKRRVSEIQAVIKDPNTEAVLLRRLDKFEKTEQYITKGITLPKMAVLLKTNTTYLSYIIKTHRDSDFSQYINRNRINYIVGKLKNHPEYLNYKIGYLAEECGFPTHSQFGSVFKTETGMSPSQFINSLKQEKNTDRSRK